MPQLGSFRKGWENENLAKFILSRFSFVAEPATISDDLGSDFYCTLFRRKKSNGYEYLIPKNSFAIQIKSNKGQFDVTNKIQYIEGLEIPFFIGVVDQQDNKISLYSGEVLPRFFSLVGFPETLKIKLTEERERYDTESRLKDYIIPFPRILDIKGDFKNNELEIIVEQLSDLCSKIQENIASKTSKEYIFADFSHSVIDVIVGKGSLENFESNFIKKLAGVYCNLNQLFKNLKEQRDIDDFMKKYNVYKKLYNELDKLYELPDWFKDFFYNLKKTVEK